MTVEIQPDPENGENGIPAYRPREYQVEMLDACMNDNTIVAMDTGTGKTDIAILRIKRELETCAPNKLIWFLTPTVALCIQQHEVISSHIPTAGTRSLTGLDDIDCWSEQYIWDAALKDIQVVVSTPGILADALCHGFVNISQLALLVFDEAHHCKRRHATNRIMQDFYHPAKKKSDQEEMPHILGLTASPVTGSNPKQLQEIELNLDARCKTPRVYRQELLRHSHRPILHRIVYEPVSVWTTEITCPSLIALFDLWRKVDIERDPYVMKLREDSDDEKLQEVRLTHKTECTDKLRKFINRTCYIVEELGEWAADFFVHVSIEQLKQAPSELVYSLDDLAKAERNYLIEFLSQLPVQDFTDTDNIPVSPKLESLITFLDQFDSSDFSGLIFVEQRATVSVMAKILSIHPKTRDRFKCAPYVGASNHAQRKNALGDLHDVKDQRDTLMEFRDGHKNLIISTEVLEEGIDISACNMVVCYDRPTNLKSFIQRRGRARQKESTYAIMFSKRDEAADFERWGQLERLIVEAYQDEQRKLSELPDLEAQEEEIVTEELSVESTGARLTAEDTVKHLYHFCSVLPQQPYDDTKPIFRFERNDEGNFRGTVTLPNCVDPTVRNSQGKSFWRTERAARKDAAFQAYKNLYHAGLINENLLPLTGKQELRLGESVDLPADLDVKEQWDPWIEQAHEWSQKPVTHQSFITVKVNDVVNEELSMVMTAPKAMPTLGPIDLYWDENTTFTLHFGESLPSKLTRENVAKMKEVTSVYLRGPYYKRFTKGNDFVTLFSPYIPASELGNWLSMNDKHTPATEVYSSGKPPLEMGFVHDHAHYDAPYIFLDWNIVEQEDGSPKVGLMCRPIPRRRNLMQRMAPAGSGNITEFADPEDQATASRVQSLPAEVCTFAKLPRAKALLGLFIPVVSDGLEKLLVVSRLRETILKDIGFETTRHVMTAISAPSAQRTTTYQQYEFFGDSVLKFVVSGQAFSDNPTWHERYLSESRDGIVRNPRLADAAIRTGLDAFILTKSFTPRKWAPPLLSQKKTATPETRKLSRKVLADVVEALIGAAYLEGGLPKARACIHTFLPEVSDHAPDFAIRSRPPTETKIANLDKLIPRIGYYFKHEYLLVEALTHPSCFYDVQTQSYQRLEFLGDAILDMVVISTIAQHSTSEISPGDMTKLKHALVNAHLLAFLCIEFTLTTETTHVSVIPAHSSKKLKTAESDKSTPQETQTPAAPTVIQEPETKQFALCDFMRSQSSVILNSQKATKKRHSALREEINHSLHDSNIFPWESLTRLNADKFFSDLIESILGAIFVDSAGDLDECAKFVDRLGLMGLLKRFLRGDVDVNHPVNVLQRLAKSEAVTYRSPPPTSGRDENGISCNRYSCSILIKNEEIATVSDCLNKDEAEVKAAALGVQVLKVRIKEEEEEAARKEAEEAPKREAEAAKKQEEAAKAKEEAAKAKMAGCNGDGDDGAKKTLGKRKREEGDVGKKESPSRNGDGDDNNDDVPSERKEDDDESASESESGPEPDPGPGRDGVNGDGDETMKDAPEAVNGSG